MVIVVLSGGIGAQVFQFAAGYELSRKNKLLINKKNIVIFCQSGKRSKIALNLLREKEFLNLKLMTENALEISRKINL